MKNGFIKVGAVSPMLSIADIDTNCQRCIEAAIDASNKGVKVLVFPELSLSGYTCADLFNQQLVIDASERVLERYIEETRELDLISFVGVAVGHFGKLYNCAAVVFRGRLLGLVAKTYIPNYSEFYEARHFSPAPKKNITINFANYRVTLGNKLLFRNISEPKLLLGCEICEDLWVNIPPSCMHAEMGANVIVNLSASNEVIGKDEYRRSLVSMHSSRTTSAYIYATSGEGESGTDMVFAAHNLIAECGKLVAEALPFAEDTLAIADIDVQKILSERRKKNTFSQEYDTDYEIIDFELEVVETELASAPDMLPFVPSDERVRMQRCQMILDIQSRGLAGRMERAHTKKLVLGLSGGLDSTLALLVATKATDLLGLPRTATVAVTMPCFGTTKRTRTNADELARLLGVEFRVVDIKKSVTQHLLDIGHDKNKTDVTYENAQARERTQVLMDIANQVGGLVVGTGDLSELVLGWATYNGDHMSMYAVNSSIPKTLVRHIVKTYADVIKAENEELASVLYDVLETPVSPELLPPKDGEIAQCTEDLVGPYDLHDYFIYYTLRHGFSPDKIYRLAKQSFAGKYDTQTILKWLRVFVKRFFTQQFKRSCLPDGPKVGSISVSPRSDLRMPSDASYEQWMRSLDGIED